MNTLNCFVYNFCIQFLFYSFIFIFIFVSVTVNEISVISVTAHRRFGRYDLMLRSYVKLLFIKTYIIYHSSKLTEILHNGPKVGLPRHIHS